MTDKHLLDIDANRAARKYPRRELVLRVLWGVMQPFFRWSPRLCWGWRRWLLRSFGAQIGTGVQVYPSVRIFAPWYFEVGDQSSLGFDVLVYNLGAVRIGARVTVSQRAHLCAGSHDYRDPAMPLTKLPITIEDEAWICADAFIGPGVTVGARAIVAARAVAIRDIDTDTIAGGNPARFIFNRNHTPPIGSVST
jgi:putative colanic acid biosynthesis acetyltransferase WcaF